MLANKVLILMVLLLTTVSIAATCAQKSYATSCTKCSFDSNGKMDQVCYDGYQNSGKGCLFAAYPLESLEYSGGNCPAIDICIDRLQTCKALYSSGNDQADCLTGDIRNCFVQGDKCVAAAVKDCKGTPPGQLESDLPPAAFCDSFFFLAFSFLGLLIYKK